MQKTKTYRPIEDTQSVLNTDRFDRRRFADLLSKSKNMAEMNEKGKEILPTFQPLMNDLWALLFKAKPELKEIDDVAESFHVNHHFIEKIMNLDGFEDFRKTTRFDDLSSSIGTLRYSETVTEWIMEQQKKNEKLKDLLNSAKQQQQEIQQLQQQIEKAQQDQQQAEQDAELAEKEGNNRKAAGAKRRANNAMQKAQQTQEQLDQAQQAMNQAMQQAGRMMAGAMANENGQNKNSLQAKLKKAQQETNEGKENIDNLLGAGNGEGELKNIPLRDQIELAETLRKNANLRKVAEWAGRFKTIARQKRKSKTEESVERSGVTIGTEIERLLPQELAFYSHPNTKLDFLRRFSEGETMMYNPKGKEMTGKGPIAVCLDQSGSMDKMDLQAKGFVLALAMIAKKERRDFAVTLFSSNTKSFLYPKGKITTKDLIQLATIFLNGGTKYTPALKDTLTLIKNNKRFKKADIIFVTDGEPYDDNIVEQFAKNELKPFKDKNGLNIMSVLLGGTNEKYVKVFSDKIIHAKDFLDDEVANHAFTI